MYTEDIPVLKDVVLVGAGHAHIQVVHRFAKDPVPGLRLTLITPEIVKPYREMLPGLICDQYTLDEICIDLEPLTRFGEARLYHSRATAFDIVNKRVVCDNRPPVPYDILSIDIGSTPSTVPGVAENAVSVKPIDAFIPQFEALVKRTLEASGPRHVAVVGGGRVGVEWLFALKDRLRAVLSEADRDPDSIAFAGFRFTRTSAGASAKNYRTAYEPPERTRCSHYYGCCRDTGRSWRASF
jgi:selenide,water dikinase